MEALAELAAATAITAQYFLRYKFRLAQQWGRGVFKCQSVHLEQPHWGLLVVCEKLISSHMAIQAII
jgi:hypothetical protein